MADPGFEPTQSDSWGRLVIPLLRSVIRVKWENTERTPHPGQQGRGQEKLFRGDNIQARRCRSLPKKGKWEVGILGGEGVVGENVLGRRNSMYKGQKATESMACWVANQCERDLVSASVPGSLHWTTVSRSLGHPVLRSSVWPVQLPVVAFCALCDSNTLQASWGQDPPSGLVPTPEQSPCQALQICWARPPGTNVSVNDLVELSCYYQKMSGNLLLVPKDLEWCQDLLLSSGNTRTTWFVWTVSAGMDGCQTTDRHCPDSNGTFRDQALLSRWDGQALLFWGNVNSDYVNKALSWSWLFKPPGKWWLSFLIRNRTLEHGLMSPFPIHIQKCNL